MGPAWLAADSIGNDQDAFLNNVAKRLNVTPAALKAALKGASDDRIDAAVTAGKITKAQGEAMKARTAEGGVPLFGGGGHHGGGFGVVVGRVARPRSDAGGGGSRPDRGRLRRDWSRGRPLPRSPRGRGSRTTGSRRR